MLTRLLLLISVAVSLHGASVFTVLSPNGKVRIEIALADSGPTVRYGAFFENRPVLHDSTLALDLAGQAPLGVELQLPFFVCKPKTSPSSICNRGRRRPHRSCVRPLRLWLFRSWRP